MLKKKSVIFILLFAAAVFALSGKVNAADTTVQSLAVTDPASGTYGVGQTITIRVTFTDTVTGGAAPTLNIQFGSGASKSATAPTTIPTAGTTTLDYTYTIATGDNGTLQIASTDYTDGDLIDSSSDDVVLTLPALSGSTITASTAAPAIDFKITNNTLTGATNALKVGVNYYLSTTAPDPSKVSWTSSNNSIATVDSSGVITGKSVGNATITATLVQNGTTSTDTYTVNVVAADTKDVVLNLSGNTSVAVGNSITLSLSGAYVFVVVAPPTLDSTNTTWVSSNTGIATVDSNGKVTGIAAGTTTITVTATINGNQYTASKIITVTQTKTLTGITITTPPTKTTYQVGDKFDPTGMVVTAAYSDGTTAAVTNYTYTPTGAIASDSAVMVSYTEGGVTKTAKVDTTITTNINNMGKDDTTADKNLPHTGIGVFTGLFIVLAAGGVIGYIRYRQLNKIV